MSDDMVVENGAGKTRVVRVNYPANSKKSKEEGQPQKPLIEKVTTGQVHQRKPTLSSRISSSFVAEDSGSVGQYIIMDVLLPAAKNMISDAISQGIDRLLFGDSRPRRSESRPGYTSYNRVSSRPTNNYEARREISRQDRANHNFGQIILETRGEAEDVIDRLRDLISNFQEAKVADLYDLIGLTGTFTDDRWGWTDLRDAKVRPVRGGYLLILPPTEPLDQ